LYTQVLHLGLTAPFPFTAVMREIACCAQARARFSGWLSSHNDLVSAISGIDSAALAALAEVHPNLPLEKAAKAAQKEGKIHDALRIAGSMCEIDLGLAL